MHAEPTERASASDQAERRSRVRETSLCITISQQHVDEPRPKVCWSCVYTAPFQTRRT